MLKKMIGLGTVMALVGCGGGGGDSSGNSGFNTSTPSTPQCTATQYLEANICRNKASQSITGLSLSAMTVGEKATLAAKASSGLAVVYSSKTPTICSVSGNQVTAIKAGECSIAANQAGDAKILAAAEVVVKTTVSTPMIASKLPQTGITTCGNETENNLPCTKAALGDLHGLGQDGEVQAGQEIAYTLLTQNGADCVQDNATGLVWEQKTDDGGLRFKMWLYTWYNTDSASNGGFEGYQDYRDLNPTLTASACGNSLSKCNTQAYIAALNAANYCGYSDWRMPGEEELSSLIYYDTDQPPSIDPIFNTAVLGLYWTASSYYYYEPNDPNGPNDPHDPNDVWAVSFYEGDTGQFSKGLNSFVLAVRAGQ